MVSKQGVGGAGAAVPYQCRLPSPPCWRSLSPRGGTPPRSTGAETWKSSKTNEIHRFLRVPEVPRATPSVTPGCWLGALGLPGGPRGTTGDSFCLVGTLPGADGVDSGASAASFWSMLVPLEASWVGKKPKLRVHH